MIRAHFYACDVFDLTFHIGDLLAFLLGEVFAGLDTVPLEHINNCDCRNLLRTFFFGIDQLSQNLFCKNYYLRHGFQLTSILKNCNDFGQDCNLVYVRAHRLHFWRVGTRRSDYGFDFWYGGSPVVVKFSLFLELQNSPVRFLLPFTR